MMIHLYISKLPGISGLWCILQLGPANQRQFNFYAGGALRGPLIEQRQVYENTTELTIFFVDL